MKKQLKFLTLILLVLSWAETGAAHSLKNSPHDVTELFLKSQVLERPGEIPRRRENDSQLKSLLNHSEAYLFMDYDKDGTNDKFDSDIDGDGVLNLVDSHPFDEKKGQEDRDGDGLYDFIDSHPEGVSKSRYGKVQETIHRETGIYLVASEVKFEDHQLETMRELLIDGIFRHLNFSQSLNVIVLRPKKDQPNLNRASFNPHWNTMNIYNVSQMKSPQKFRETFLHEMGHVFGKIVEDEKEKLLSKSQTKKRIFPSQYAETNTEEWFAEAFVSTLYLIGEVNSIDTNRYNRLRAFEGTEDFYAIKEMWEERKGKEKTSFPFR